MAETIDLGSGRYHKNSPPSLQLMTRVNAPPPGYVYYPRGRLQYGPAQHQGRQWPVPATWRELPHFGNTKALILKRVPSRSDLDSISGNRGIASEPPRDGGYSGAPLYQPRYERQSSASFRKEQGSLSGIGSRNPNTLRRSQSIPDHLHVSSTSADFAENVMSLSRQRRKERVPSEQETVHSGEVIRIQVPAYEYDAADDCDTISNVSGPMEDIDEVFQQIKLPAYSGQLVKDKFRSEPSLFDPHDNGLGFSTMQRPPRRSNEWSGREAGTSLTLPRGGSRARDNSAAMERESFARTVVMTNGNNGYGFTLRCVKATENEQTPPTEMGTFPKVEKVSEGSIAQKAGIQVHDIVLEINNETVLDSSIERCLRLITSDAAMVSMKIQTPTQIKLSSNWIEAPQKLSVKENRPQPSELNEKISMKSTPVRVVEKTSSLTKTMSDKFLDKERPKLSRFKTESSLSELDRGSSSVSNFQPSTTENAKVQPLLDDANSTDANSEQNSIYEELYDLDLPAPRKNRQTHETSSLQLESKEKDAKTAKSDDDNSSVKSVPNTKWFGTKMSIFGNDSGGDKEMAPIPRSRELAVEPNLHYTRAISNAIHTSFTTRADQTKRHLARVHSTPAYKSISENTANNIQYGSHQIDTQYSTESGYGTVSSETSLESEIGKRDLLSRKLSSDSISTVSSGHALGFSAGQDVHNDAILHMIPETSLRQESLTLSSRESSQLRGRTAKSMQQQEGRDRKVSVPPPVASKPKISFSKKRYGSVPPEPKKSSDDSSESPKSSALIKMGTSLDEKMDPKERTPSQISSIHKRPFPLEETSSQGVVAEEDYMNGDQIAPQSLSNESLVIDNIYENLDGWGSGNSEQSIFDGDHNHSRISNKTVAKPGSLANCRNEEELNLPLQIEKKYNAQQVSRSPFLDQTVVAKNSHTLPSIPLDYHRPTADKINSVNLLPSPDAMQDNCNSESIQAKPSGVMEVKASLTQSPIAQLAKILALGMQQYREGNSGTLKKLEKSELSENVIHLNGVTVDNSSTDLLIGDDSFSDAPAVDQKQHVVAKKQTPHISMKPQINNEKLVSPETHNRSKAHPFQKETTTSIFENKPVKNDDTTGKEKAQKQKKLPPPVTPKTKTFRSSKSLSPTSTAPYADTSKSTSPASIAVTSPVSSKQPTKWGIKERPSTSSSTLPNQKLIKLSKPDDVLDHNQNNTSQAARSAIVLPTPQKKKPVKTPSKLSASSSRLQKLPNSISVTSPGASFNAPPVPDFVPPSPVASPVRNPTSPELIHIKDEIPSSMPPPLLSQISPQLPAPILDPWKSNPGSLVTPIYPPVFSPITPPVFSPISPPPVNPISPEIGPIPPPSFNPNRPLPTVPPQLYRPGASQQFPPPYSPPTLPSPFAPRDPLSSDLRIISKIATPQRHSLENNAASTASFGDIPNDIILAPPESFLASCERLYERHEGQLPPGSSSYSNVKRISRSQSKNELLKMRLSMASLDQIESNPSILLPPEGFDNSTSDISQLVISPPEDFKHLHPMVRTNQNSLLQTHGFESKPIADWSIEDVSHWLRHQDLAQHADRFTAEKVDGAKLITLDRQRLIALGMTSVEHRRNVERAVRKLMSIK